MVRTRKESKKQASPAFTERLLHWHHHSNNRQMPWKGEKDPYKIWLSEIILQQTRVEQGLAYYEKFIRHYPTIEDLAAADSNQVFKDWEGLGYYSRCKNLLHTANVITQQYGGVFPEDYDKILALKGVGPYTAAAILAFAFNQPYAVLDGNVFRVLSRIYGIATPIDSTEGKLVFSELADRVLSKEHPAAYNQAIMDFGATVCKPATPLCGSCPMKEICVARKKAEVGNLPKKAKVLKKKTRHITWLVLENEFNHLIYIQKRTAGDIWENLHEYYPIESDGKPDWNRENLQELIVNQLGEPPIDIHNLGSTTQQLTHQKIHGYFYKIRLKKAPEGLKRSHWLSRAKINELAFPKLLKELNINIQ